MAVEMVMEETGSVDSTTVQVRRTSATVKGGRRFTFGALVIVGDRNGRVGVGYGKANEVPQAVEKATKYAKRTMVKVPMAGRTVPHEVEGKYSSSKVRLIPATPGTGVVAGSTLRAILEMAGITDCLSKCYGSTNATNIIKATFDAVGKLKTRERTGTDRGISITETDIENRIERGKKFMPVGSGKEKMRGPVNNVGAENKRGGRRGGGGRGPRGGGDDRGNAPAADSGAPAAAPEAPKQ